VANANPENEIGDEKSPKNRLPQTSDAQSLIEHPRYNANNSSDNDSKERYEHNPPEGRGENRAQQLLVNLRFGQCSSVVHLLLNS
jgi:hypothetical protein